MRTLVISAMTAVLGFGAANADDGALSISSKIRNPSAPLTSLHAEALIPIVSQMGLDYEGVTLPNGDKALLVSTATGSRFQITPMACGQDGRCKGMHLVSMFETDVDRRTVSAFNDRYAFVSAGLSKQDLAYLARYEIADFGLPRGNIAVSIDVFLETSRLFADHLEQATGKLKQAPDGSDLSANALNMESLMTSVSLRAGNRELYESHSHSSFVPHGHAISFEQTHDIVETYVRAEEVYPGRIVNHIGN